MIRALAPTTLAGPTGSAAYRDALRSVAGPRGVVGGRGCRNSLSTCRGLLAEWLRVFDRRASRSSLVAIRNLPFCSISVTSSKFLLSFLGLLGFPAVAASPGFPPLAGDDVVGQRGRSSAA
jgi:hypothetical protein